MPARLQSTAITTWLRGHTRSLGPGGPSLVNGPDSLSSSSPEAPLPPNVGRYRIVGRLGAGGMGVVYRAHDPQLGRDVAIKKPIFRGTGASATKARQHFFREARAAAAVRHAHVCPIYDVGEEHGPPYVVLALIEGETLGERLRRQGRFDEPRAAVALLLRVADALTALHAARIVHRDLKPGNILLDRAGQPFLTDFGLARAADCERLTAVGQLMGTPAYMAPEQAAPELGPAGPPADRYSLGVVLYYTRAPVVSALEAARPASASLGDGARRHAEEETAAAGGTSRPGESPANPRRGRKKS